MTVPDFSTRPRKTEESAEAVSALNPCRWLCGVGAAEVLKGAGFAETQNKTLTARTSGHIVRPPTLLISDNADKNRAFGEDSRMTRLNSAAAALFLLCLFALSASEARADTIVLQNVSGVMVFENRLHGDATSRLSVTANEFSVSARNIEAGGPGTGIMGIGGNNWIDRASGSFTYMGQSSQDFIWSATFDGTNVTGSVRWVDHINPLLTIHVFTFSGTGTLVTEALTG